jgi:lipopolysaccharide exporter
MSVRQSIARGAVWTVLYKWVDRSLGFASTLILAHLLVPADFGLVAMGTSLSGLLLTLTYFGLDTALLRQKETTEHHFNAVWTLNALCGCAIAALMLAFAVPAAHFYREPRVTAVICTLAAAPFLQGLENVGVVMFRKEMRFDREFRYMFIARIVKFAVTVFLAFTLRSYWALVCGIVAWRAVAVVISYLMQPFRPRFSLQSLGELMHFSKWLMAHNALSFLRDRSSDFVVGRLSGSSSLGLFSVAAEISDMPGTELVGPINRAVLPAYMTIAHDLPALRREYVSVLSMVALLAVPAVAGFAVCAPFLVLLFLGPKWLQTADLIEILAFYGITRVIQSNAYSAYLALGKPQYYVGVSASHVSILLLLQVVFTLQAGLHGAAWAYVLASVIALPIDFFFLVRFMGLRPSIYAASLWRPFSSAALMYLTVRMFGPPLLGNVALPAAQAAYSFLVCVAIGAPTYIISEFLLWVCAGRPAESAEAAAVRRIRTVFSRISVSVTR